MEIFLRILPELSFPLKAIVQFLVNLGELIFSIFLSLQIHDLEPVK